ncbi:MAG: shikimate kinase [Candidatus Taylorbacteria bacterium]|nr:shikimate kinase [Candidatus Taylorbacteria bacterium]
MRHIIFIGFKSAGKTVIGRRLAERLGRKFVDLDTEIEKREEMTARDIVLKEGEVYFRNIESEVLREIVKNNENNILALGGGAAMVKENQEMIKEHTVILVTAPKEVLFERIMKRGRPAFFPKELSDRDAFEKLYADREPVYEKLATVKVENVGTVEEAVGEIARIMN